jgi:hypothetical protein
MELIVISIPICTLLFIAMMVYTYRKNRLGAFLKQSSPYSEIFLGIDRKTLI